MSKKEINVNHFDDRLAAVYSQTENKEKQYDNWASSYETDLVDDMEYVAHKATSDIFAKYCTDKSANILDVACGTGLVGQYLLEIGYRTIDGADFSNEMLNVAEKRDVYRQLWQHDFTQPKTLDEKYDALICVGMFSFSIPKISDMHHVVNCVKPGSLCIITINGEAWKQLDLGKQVEETAKEHNFIVEDIIRADYIRKEGIDSRVLIIRS